MMQGKLIITNRAHFMQVARFAKARGQWGQLKQCLLNMACDKGNVITLWPDHYDNCFAVAMDYNGYKCNGGLIYHGESGEQVNGSVSIDPTGGWSVHT
jgi:hypothetical protein